MNGVGAPFALQGRVSYYVKWAGFPDAQSTWEPKENIDSRLVEDFDAQVAPHGVLLTRCLFKPAGTQQ